jgi:hypothetical protein
MLFLFLFLFEPCAASVFQIFFRTQMLSQRLLVGAVRTAMARHGCACIEAECCDDNSVADANDAISRAERSNVVVGGASAANVQTARHQQNLQRRATKTTIAQFAAAVVAKRSRRKTHRKRRAPSTPCRKRRSSRFYEAGQYEKAIALFNEQTRVSEGAVKAYLRSLAATQQMHHFNVANLIALLLGPEVVTIGARPTPRS